MKEEISSLQQYSIFKPNICRKTRDGFPIIYNFYIFLNKAGYKEGHPELGWGLGPYSLPPPGFVGFKGQNMSNLNRLEITEAVLTAHPSSQPGAIAEAGQVEAEQQAQV